MDITRVIAVVKDLTRVALEPQTRLDVFLAELLRQTRQLVPFELGWLLLREGEWLRIRAADPAHQADLGQAFPLDDCISGLSLVRGAAVYIPDLLQALPELQAIYKASRTPGPPMRSELVVPLLAGERAIGALNIESRHPAAFDTQHIEILQLLSSYASQAIELARSREEAAALGAIGLELAHETALPAIARLVLQHALALIGARFGQLLLRESHELVVHYTTNLPPRDLGLRVGFDDSISGLAVLERRPVLVADVTQPDYLVLELQTLTPGEAARVEPRRTVQPRYQRVLEREKDRIRAELAVPFWSAERLVGVLNVETPRESGFSAAQQAALLEFTRRHGPQLAEALERREQVSLRHWLDAALQCVETEFGQILQLEENELIIRQTSGAEPPGILVPLNASVSGLAISRRTPVYAPDVEAEPRYRRYLGAEMKSELAVPLISGEQVVGVLNVESPVPAFFNSEHARILQALAGQAAVAIERSRRFEVERLAAIGGLAGDIIHRLNNPIGALSGWLDHLTRRAEYPQLVEQHPYLAQFVARAEHDLAHAKSIMRELRAELRRQQPGPLELQAAIAEGLQRAGLLPDSGPIQLQLELPARPVLVLAGPSLSSVFWNLFDNARKAMPAGGRLAIRAQPLDAEILRVEISDSGPGIEPWRLPFLFDAGTSSSVDAYAPVHGLGLWWTRSQLEGFGGSIEVSSTPGSGSTFRIQLRLAS